MAKKLVLVNMRSGKEIKLPTNPKKQTQLLHSMVATSSRSEISFGGRIVAEFRGVCEKGDESPLIVSARQDHGEEGIRERLADKLGFRSYLSAS